MKKCPSCYAFMKESSTSAEAPKSKQHRADGAGEVAAVRVRYECFQCGHMEESFAKAAPVPKS